MNPINPNGTEITKIRPDSLSILHEESRTVTTYHLGHLFLDE